MTVRKRFGQHFLEPVWADKLVAVIAPTPDDRVFEIGPGEGVLTLRLAPLVSRLIAVEIDRDLAARLGPRLPPNATLISGDILSVDLAGLLPGDASGGNWRVVGNLPYNITSPILSRLLAIHAVHPLADATLMLQREVADRLTARPGMADFGPLGIAVQWHAAVSRLLTLPPGAFRPAPKVHSAVVRLAFRPPPFPLRDPEVFSSMTRTMFTRRRKTVENALAPFSEPRGLSAAEALARAGLDPRRRPEALEIVEIARLADVFAAAND